MRRESPTRASPSSARPSVCRGLQSRKNPPLMLHYSDHLRPVAVCPRVHALTRSQSRDKENLQPAGLFIAEKPVLPHAGPLAPLLPGLAGGNQLIGQTKGNNNSGAAQAIPAPRLRRRRRRPFPRKSSNASDRAHTEQRDAQACGDNFRRNVAVSSAIDVLPAAGTGEESHSQLPHVFRHSPRPQFSARQCCLKHD